MENINNRAEFISNYRLSKNEYCLLPREIRLTYADMLYRWEVDKAKEQGENIRRGYMQEEYVEYFEACGCELTNYDFGVEEYEIKSVSDVDFTPTEENKGLVLEYVKSVAEIRWGIYETAVKDVLYDQLANLSRGNIVDSDLNVQKLNRILSDDIYSEALSDEVKKELVKQELDSCIDSREEAEMNVWLGKPYVDEIKAKGYTIEQNGDSIIARILK